MQDLSSLRQVSTVSGAVRRFRPVLLCALRQLSGAFGSFRRLGILPRVTNETCEAWSAPSAVAREAPNAQRLMYTPV
eukprot:8126775-Alexandrium_andersonii.AAC.1